MKKTSLVLLLFLALLAQASPAFAHPADIYNHSIEVTLAKADVSIQWEITPGPMLVSFIWSEADSDKDGAVSLEEAEKWANSRVMLFTATLEYARFPLQLDSVQFPSSMDRFQSGAETITLRLSATWPENLSDSYELVLYNGVEISKSLSWYSVTAQDDLKFQTPQQRNNILTLEVLEPPAQVSVPSDLRTEWDSSTPSFPQQPQSSVTQSPEQTAISGLLPSKDNTTQNILLNFVRTPKFSPFFYVFALGVALILGALHALTPGHGKTVVAAYLVGSRGTAGHAVALGTIVTLTHTGSVLLLGIVTLVASRYILPTSLIPLLEVVSGLLIVGLGVYLLWQRIQQWRKTTTNKPSRRYSLKPPSSGMKIRSGTYNIQKAHSDHEHGHGHTHDHGDGHIHSHDFPEAITWRSLIALGISGGLVPCPDAIAILLVAIAINRIVLGLTLIVSFSLGLAVVLIVIGLLMVNSRRLFDRIRVFDAFAPVLPMVSAVVVLVLGAALTAGASVRLKDAFNLAGEGSGSPSKTQVIYLAGGPQQAKQLFVTDIKRIDPVLLSDAKENVTEYALSPDQRNLVYITESENLENKIWLVDVESHERRVLLDCANAICSRPVWSPDGRRIVYEYTRLWSDNLTGLATLWWVDIASSETKPVFQETRLPGWNPRWSPDGKWLSYATSEELRFHNLETGESHAIKSTIAPAADWSLDSKKVLYGDVLLQDRQFITQIFVYDLSTKLVVNVNPDPRYENLFAAWSPDGEWIAVVRRDLSVPLGDQIWVMRAEGGAARALTAMPDTLHNNMTWSPDGKYLLYDARFLNAASEESNLQMLEVESGEMTDLGIKGYQAKWLWQ